MQRSTTGTTKSLTATMIGAVFGLNERGVDGNTIEQDGHNIEQDAGQISAIEE